MQLNVFFPTNAVYSLKKFNFSNVERELLFFSSTAWIRPEKRTLGVRHVQPRCWCFFLLVWFMPEIPEQTSDWEWHKTSRSRVHPVKIHLIILHVPTFSMGFSKKCVRSGPLNLQRQVVRAEGKTRYMKFELFQNSRCHFSQF